MAKTVYDHQVTVFATPEKSCADLVMEEMQSLQYRVPHLIEKKYVWNLKTVQSQDGSKATFEVKIQDSTVEEKPQFSGELVFLIGVIIFVIIAAAFGWTME